MAEINSNMCIRGIVPFSSYADLCHWFSTVVAYTVCPAMPVSNSDSASRGYHHLLAGLSIKNSCSIGWLALHSLPYMGTGTRTSSRIRQSRFVWLFDDLITFLLRDWPHVQSSYRSSWLWSTFSFLPFLISISNCAFCWRRKANSTLLPHSLTFGPTAVAIRSPWIRDYTFWSKSKFLALSTVW